jgi:hypothetical protein
MRIIGLRAGAAQANYAVTKALPRLIAGLPGVDDRRPHGFDLDQPGKDPSCTAPPAPAGHQFGQRPPSCELRDDQNGPPDLLASHPGRSRAG